MFVAARMWFLAVVSRCAGVLILSTTAAVMPAAAQPTPEQVFAGIVRLEATIPADARTAAALGTERVGSGVVIDKRGLILTIGYLILEASEVIASNHEGISTSTEIIAYDYATGFGLLRTDQPLDITPLQLGESSQITKGDPVLVISYGGPRAVQVAHVASRRDFAGYWEYLLEDAIFTSPPYPQFAGAALLGAEGNLVGIGSLFVRSAAGSETTSPGNMFVPIDALKPVLDELIADGRSSAQRRPWLGIFLEELRGHLLVTRVADEGPAESAGVKVGDIMLKVAGQPFDDLADFYRKVWALGGTGVDVPLEVLRKSEIMRISVHSSNRYDWLRLNPPKPSTNIEASLTLPVPDSV